MGSPLLSLFYITLISMLEDYFKKSQHVAFNDSKTWAWVSKDEEVE